MTRKRAAKAKPLRLGCSPATKKSKQKAKYSTLLNRRHWDSIRRKLRSVLSGGYLRARDVLVTSLPMHLPGLFLGEKSYLPAYDVGLISHESIGSGRKGSDNKTSRIYLDQDSVRIVEFRRYILLPLKKLGYRVQKYRRIRTKRGWHHIIIVHPYCTAESAIIIQWYLASQSNGHFDYARECANLRRARASKNGDTFANVLFKKKL